jgi:hypothetical protein
MLDLKVISNERQQYINILLMMQQVVVASYSMTPDGSAFTRLDVHQVKDLLKIELNGDLAFRKEKEISIEFDTYNRSEALYYFGCFVRTLEILTDKPDLKEFVLNKIHYANYNTIFLANVLGDYCVSQKIDNEVPTFVSNFELKEEIEEGTESIELRFVTNRKKPDHDNSLYALFDKFITSLKSRQF